MGKEYQPLIQTASESDDGTMQTGRERTKRRIRKKKEEQVNSGVSASESGDEYMGIPQIKTEGTKRRIREKQRERENSLERVFRKEDAEKKKRLFRGM